MDNYQKAFLDLISYCEGTYGQSQNGYDVLYSENPNELRLIEGWTEDTTIVHGNEKWKVYIGNNLYTTAAGRYQFLGSTWIGINNNVNAPINKKNQDNACLNLTKTILGQNFDFNLSDETKMTNVVSKLNKTWTSLNKFRPKQLSLLYKEAYYKYQQ
jgi:muramidase (phage lysozyme)